MKNLLLLLISSLTFQFGYAQKIQEISETKNSIGIDAIAGVALLFGNLENYQILEISYIRKLTKLDLRFKININSNDFMEEELIYRKTIDEANEIVYNSRYTGHRNYILSAGIAKRIHLKKMDYYLGIDSNLGLATGNTYSRLKDYLNEENDIYKGRQRSISYILGATPIIGSKIQLHQKISLEIEFGLPIMFNFGGIVYLDELEIRSEKFVKRYDIGFDKLLNDVRISYNF